MATPEEYWKNLRELQRPFAQVAEKAIGVSMNGKIDCPRCLAYGAEQPLHCDGDNPDILMCPHCNLTLSLEVKLNYRENLDQLKRLLEQSPLKVES